MKATGPKAADIAVSNVKQKDKKLRKYKYKRVTLHKGPCETSQKFVNKMVFISIIV